MSLAATVLASAVSAGAGCGGPAGPEDEIPDAGLVDAGPPDAGITDAGLGDAGTGDAGPPDPMTYFLVAEWPGDEVHGDSYVLPVIRPEDIAHARDLIERGPQAAGMTIAVATVRLGADGINRDLRAAGQPAWSWHVVALEGFADCSLEILDGWPGWIEQDPAAWMENTPPDEQIPDVDGTIGFWGYTVVEELEGYPQLTEQRQGSAGLGQPLPLARPAAGRTSPRRPRMPGMPEMIGHCAGQPRAPGVSAGEQ